MLPIALPIYRFLPGFQALMCSCPVHTNKPSWDVAFAIEVALLLLSAPAVYFPSFFPQWVVYSSLFLLFLGWLWRRAILGYFLCRTPMDWALLLFVIMLPVSLWAAPPSLRTTLSLPRGYIVLWNFCLFWTVAVHARRSNGLFRLAAVGFVLAGLVLSFVGLLGLGWKSSSVPALRPWLPHIPTPLAGRLPGAEAGIHPNQLAGTILYVLPLLWLWTVHALRQHRFRYALPGLTAATGMTIALILTQSRGGYLGFITAGMVLSLFPSPKGRRLLLTMSVLLLLALPFLPYEPILNLIAETPPVEALGGISTFEFRQTVWQSAVLGLRDFAPTGMGLGTFRRLAFLLYPMPRVAPTFDLGDAHHFFLQTGLDFGLPGLIAVLAIYCIALWGSSQIWFQGNESWQRLLGLGAMAGLIGQGVYSQLNAVTMGSKPNLLLWYLWALIAAGMAWIERRKEEY